MWNILFFIRWNNKLLFKQIEISKYRFIALNGKLEKNFFHQPNPM